MPLDRKSIVAIVVAAMGVLGSVLVAAITSGRTFDTRFSEMQSQTAQLRKDLDAAKGEVSTLASDTAKLQKLVEAQTGEAPRCVVRLHQVAPQSALTVSATGGGGAEWADFPELRLGFRLTERRSVLIGYHLTDAVLAVPGSYILSRLVLDGEVLNGTQSITGETDRYRTAQALWAGALEPGAHTVKVQYRSPQNGRNHPLEADTDTRTLFVAEVGCPTDD